MGAEGLEGGGARAPPARPVENERSMIHPWIRKWFESSKLNLGADIMKILRDKYIDQYGNICLEWSTGYVGWVQLIRLC